MKQLELESKGGNSKDSHFIMSKSESAEITTELIESNSKIRCSRVGKGLSLKKY